MKRTVHVVEHWPLPPDAGRQHLVAQDFDVEVHEPFAGGTLPQLTGDEAGVMIMGGPQMVSEHEAWPYLAHEFAFIEQALALDIPLIGVCLGSQMIAHVLGAKVGYRDDGHMAMGFYGLEITQAGQGLMPDGAVLNGNSQGWDLPNGAQLLARGIDNPFANQAFRYGEKVLALQFHPEVTRPILDQWQTDFASSIGRPGTQSRAEQDAGFERHDGALKDWYRATLDRWFSQPAPSRSPRG